MWIILLRAPDFWKLEITPTNCAYILRITRAEYLAMLTERFEHKFDANSCSQDNFNRCADFPLSTPDYIEDVRPPARQHLEWQSNPMQALAKRWKIDISNNPGEDKEILKDLQTSTQGRMSIDFQHCMRTDVRYSKVWLTASVGDFKIILKET